MRYIIILLLTVSIGCGKKLPKSVKDKQAIKKDIAKPVTLKKGESLALAVKNPDLFPEYNVKVYEYLNQDSLFKKINGAADGYISNHGFVGCGYVELKHKLEDITLILWVYDMDRAINAFGIYSSELNQKANFINVGTEGYLTDQGIVFWKNKYYIKIDLQSDKDKAIIISLAKAINKIIHSDSDVLKKFDIFPKENRVDHGERFYYGNFGGQSYFRDVYEVKYKSGKVGSPDKIFLTFVKDIKAKEILRKYKDYLSSELTGIKSIGKGFYAIDKLEDKPILLSIGSNHLIGILGFSNLDNQKKVLRRIIKNIN